MLYEVITLEDPAPQGVRARLEQRAQARLRVACAQRGEVEPDRRRMVREVVVDGDAGDDAAHLEPAFDTASYNFV